MRLSGGQPAPEFAEPAFTKEAVLERLEHWRRVLADKGEGSNVVMTRAEIVRTLDRWLDELIELRGR